MIQTILHRKKKERKIKQNTIGMQLFLNTDLFYDDNLPSSVPLSECHWAIGLRGEASISDQ